MPSSQNLLQNDFLALPIFFILIMTRCIQSQVKLNVMHIVLGSNGVFLFPLHVTGRQWNHTLNYFNFCYDGCHSVMKYGRLPI